jgi:hypothetical protein
MGVYKRILGFSNYNRTLAAKRLNTPGGYRNQNQGARPIRLSEADLRDFNADIVKLLKQIKNEKAIEAIVYPASEIIRDRAKQLTPVAEPRKRQKGFRREFSPKRLRPDVLYFYKKEGAKRAGKGKGKIRYKYGLGNIKSSIQVISKEKGYKTPIGIIGPMFTKVKTAINPNEKRFNGWYAHMIFGGAKQFGEKVTYRALRDSKTMVFNQISAEVNKYLNRTKTNLRKVS